MPDRNVQGLMAGSVFKRGMQRVGWWAVCFGKECRGYYSKLYLFWKRSRKYDLWRIGWVIFAEVEYGGYYGGQFGVSSI